MDDHAGRVEHAPQARRARGRELARAAARARSPGSAPARISSRARSITARAASTASGSSTPARQLVHRRQIAQLHGERLLRPRRGARSCRASSTRWTASRGSSVKSSSARSSGETMPSASSRSSHPVEQRRQYAESKSTTGKCRTLPVWISVSDSNSSSTVPKPPGKTTKPSRRLHEHRLARVEVVERQLDVEVRVLVLLVRQLDVEADDSPPPSWQPRFAASITPGPPPVTTAQPASANASPSRARRSYAGASRSRARSRRSTQPAGRCARPPRSRSKNSSAISRCARGVVLVLVRLSRSPGRPSQRAVGCVATCRARAPASRRRERRSAARAPGRARTPASARRPRTGSAACATPRVRANDLAAVEEAER